MRRSQRSTTKPTEPTIDLNVSLPSDENESSQEEQAQPIEIPTDLGALTRAKKYVGR